MPERKFYVAGPSSVKSKTISDGTFVIYRGFLNRLAKQKIYMPAEILAKQAEIVEIIKASNETNPKRRLFLSAVLWVIADYPEDQKATLRQFQQTVNDFPAPGTVLKNGQVWLSKEEFVAKQSAPLAGSGFSFVS
jgi:hypothetical protein